MIKHVGLLVAIVVPMMAVMSVRVVTAQEEPPIQLLTYEFSDGTVVRYPAAYELVLPENGDDASQSIELRANRADFFITVYTTEQRAEYGLATPLDAMQYYVERVEGLDVDFEPTLDVTTNGRTIAWVRYADEGIVGTIASGRCAQWRGGRGRWLWRLLWQRV